MKLVAVVPYYPPIAGRPQKHGGSEFMLHDLLRAAAARAGHLPEVLLVTAEPGREYMLDGITVRPVGRAQAVPALTSARPDVIVTQLLNHSRVGTPEAPLVRRRAARLIKLVHDDGSLASIRALEPDLVVYNSQWLSASYGELPFRSVVVLPPVDRAKHEAAPGDRITLVNLDRRKGVSTFYRLAERADAGRRFLAVLGGWGDQVLRPELGNVEYQPYTTRMGADVWSRTRVLLVPSEQESWGMAAVEAMLCGIPVVAHPTPGLRESLGPAGIFADKDDIGAWESALRRLDDPVAYQRQSELARARAEELCSAGGVDTWLAELAALEQNGHRPQGVR